MIFSSAQIARDNCYDENLHILVLISSYIIVHREQCRICLVLYAEGKKKINFFLKAIGRIIKGLDTKKLL